jgi:hypothetical protein
MIIGHLSTNKKPNLMNILFLLVVLFCLVQVIISSPVSCDSGSKKMGSILEEEVEFYSDVVKFSELSKKCQDQEVCVFRCPCGKAVFFTDFTSNADPVIAAQIGQAYNTVCVRNIVDGKKQTSWINQLLITLSKTVKLSNEASRPTELTENSPLSKIIFQFLRTRELPLMYIARFTEVLLTFQKICTEDPEWKKNVDEKIKLYMDKEVADVSSRFSGNEFLKKDFVNKLENSWKFYSFVKKTDPVAAETMKYARTQLTAAFSKMIKENQDSLVCKCNEMFSALGSGLPSSFSTAAESSCQKECSKTTTLEDDEEFEE